MQGTNETEADTRANRIDPALREAAWGVVEGSRIRREMIYPGRISGRGTNDAKRQLGEVAKISDAFVAMQAEMFKGNAHGVPRHAQFSWLMRYRV